MSRSRHLAAMVVPLLSAAVALPTPASAQINEQAFRSGRTRDLATLCAANDRTEAGIAARAWCNAFIVATAQYHGSAAAANPAIGRHYCIPDPDAVTLDQVRTAFVAWERSHPEYADTRAVDGLVRFAATTWPCRPPATSSGRAPR